jgi:transcriptional regulator with XRE-family HTH domain
VSRRTGQRHSTIPAPSLRAPEGQQSTEEAEDQADEREAARLSADDVAESMGFSQAKVTRIELAQSGPSKGDLFLLLRLYGVADEEHDSYWELAKAGRERGWWFEFKDVLGKPLGEYIAFEDAASSIKAWSPLTVHGLLQTEAYARATFAGGLQRTAEEVDRVVSSRMERQKRLVSGKLALWAVLDETLLARPVGGRDVLRDQLDHLLRLPSAVTLQVIPMGTNWHPGLTSSFTLMDFTDYPSVAFPESPFKDSYVDVPAEVAAYSVLFDQLRAAGENPKTSRHMIESARDRLTN